MLSKPRPGVWPVLIFTVWTLYVWLNRISNALGNDAISSASKAFSVALSLTVVALTLRVAAGWAGGLWLVLVPKILIDGRPAGFDGNLAAFKAVHAVLGLISIGLAALVWRSTTRVYAGDESRPAVSAG